MTRFFPASQPLLPVLAGAVFISFSGVWVTWSAASPAVSAFYRVFFGACFLTLACLLQGDFRPVSAATLWLTGLCGFTFAADLFCWHASITRVGPGLATILANFQVFVLAFITVACHKTTLRPAFLVAIPLAVAGLLLVIGIDWSLFSPAYRSGIYYGLATALCYAAFILLLRRVQEREQGLSFFYGLLLVSLTSSLFLAVWVLATGDSFAITTPAALGSLLGLALLSQTIGWALIANSLPALVPATAGLVLLLQPALAFVWDVMIFHRSTSPGQWTGVALTLVAIYLGMAATSQQQRPGYRADETH